MVGGVLFEDDDPSKGEISFDALIERGMRVFAVARWEPREARCASGSSRIPCHVR